MRMARYLVPIVAIVLAACSNGSGRAGSTAGGPSANVTAAAPGEARGFREYPIGDEQEVEGLLIAAVYFQPVPMEPTGMALHPDQADIHLEADISATPENKTGFGIGEWVPYLTVKYRISRQDDGRAIEGSFMPMNASDGPHYGANVKMLGAGTYDVSFVIANPEKQGFLLHVDPETGVPGRFWREPIEVSWRFDYLPRKW